MRVALWRILSVGIFLSGSLGLIHAQQDSTTGQATAADNTKVNRGDNNASATTADQQGKTPADRKLTQQIRQALVKDKSLSTYATNIKIISQNGMVTLKGPVRSEEEKQAIETKAKDVAGAGNVTNELQVAANP